jgi:hypothetical protein
MKAKWLNSAQTTADNLRYTIRYNQQQPNSKLENCGRHNKTFDARYSPGVGTRRAPPWVRQLSISYDDSFERWWKDRPFDFFGPTRHISASLRRGSLTCPMMLNLLKPSVWKSVIGSTPVTVPARPPMWLNVVRVPHVSTKNELPMSSRSKLIKHVHTLFRSDPAIILKRPSPGLCLQISSVTRSETEAKNRLVGK